MEIIIKNGIIVNAGETLKADILVSDGFIRHIGYDIDTDGSQRIIDASGLYVLPGGIDPHVHMQLPSPAGYSADDFASGSMAALSGGTTTMIDFVTPARGENLTEALEKRKKEASASLINCGLHVSPVEWNNSTPAELNECTDRGIRSFKVYMAYRDTIGLSDDSIIKVMETASLSDSVVLVHCETGPQIDKLSESLFVQGKYGPEWHPISRPPEMEAKAVAKAIELAEKAGCRIYIVHVSSELSLEHIRKAKAEGLRIFAETCPQYLLFDDSVYSGSFEQSARFVISPPLRKKSDITALWRALADGTIDTVATDHCPFSMESKLFGRTDFRKIPGGAGGVGHRLELLYTCGVLQDRITINRFVELISARAADIFGLAPLRGRIAEESIADLVVWNPETERVITAYEKNQRCDINIYEGLPVKGSAAFVMTAGIISYSAGNVKS